MKNSGNHTRLEKLLLEAARDFNSTLEYEELIELVLKLVIKAVEAETALIVRVDHSRTDIKVRYMQCADCELHHFTRELGAGVIGWVANYKEPVIINNPATDERVDLKLMEQLNCKIESLISVPLIGKGKMIGVIEAINKENGKFSDNDLDILIGLSNQIAVVIDNANLYRAVKREALQKDLLYETGIKLSSSLELDDVLAQIMSALKQVVEYEAGGFFLVNSTGSDLDSIYSVGYDEKCIPDLHTKMGEGLVGHAAKLAAALIVPDVSIDERYVNCRPETKSEIVVPIMLDGRVIGLVNLESNRLNAFDVQDESLMKAFASQAAISVERARLHHKLISSQKLEQQLSIAREIQRSFLPRRDPKIDGYDICGRNFPSGEVGGDYFDFIDIVKGQTGIAIADVVGKGIPAALIMASFRASLIAEIRNNYSIRTICEKVNSLMVESLEPGNFVTAVYSVLDSKNNILTFSNAGHNQPLLVRRDGSVEFLKEGGPILGVIKEATFEERPIVINSGDIVIFYTDGVTEVFDKAGNEFGVEAILRVVGKNQNSSAAEILNRIVEAVKAFASPDHLFDDVTIVVLKRP